MSIKSLFYFCRCCFQVWDFPIYVLFLYPPSLFLLFVFLFAFRFLLLFFPQRCCCCCCLTMHLSILSKDCPWWGHNFFFFFPTKSIQQTKPTLSLSRSCILTLRGAGAGAGFGALVLILMCAYGPGSEASVYLQRGNERAVTSPWWMRCDTAELLEGLNWGKRQNGTFSMYYSWTSDWRGSEHDWWIS